MAGSGTALDPFQIATPSDLAKVGTGTDGWNMDSHYLQTANIDISGYSSGGGWTPIGISANSFVGNFDGNGFIISNLFIDRSGTNVQGLFGYIGEGADVTRVALEGVNIVAGSNVGALAAINYGSIADSYAIGEITGGSGIGGLVGVNHDYISGSYASVDITANGYSAGGLFANNSGTIINSYATGSVTNSGSMYYSGGLGGKNFSTITNCYSTGAVSGGFAIGGLLGSNSGTVTASFWDTQTSGCATSAAGTGKTTAEMKDIDTFSTTWDIVEEVNYDFENPAIWYINDGADYPGLGWQLVPPIEGGSESTVTVTAEGAGTKEGIAPTSEPTITVTATGSGTKSVADSSESPIAVTSTGAGAKATSGPATPSEAAVTVAAEGAGSKVAIGPDAESTVVIAAEGAGVKAASGASETAVTVGVESGGEAYFVMPPEITIEQVGSVIRLSW